MPRTDPSTWGRLFNFLGAGLVHFNLFPYSPMSADNPTLFEAISMVILLNGTHAARPAAANVPLNAVYFETDTTDLFQNIEGTWTQIASIGGSSGATLAQGTLAGRGSASGSGVYEQLTVGSGLSLTGTTLTASGGGGGTPGLELVEYKLVTANSTQQTFNSLDGNTDGQYKLKARLKNNSGSTSVYSWRPNNVTTNQQFQRLLVTGTSTPSASTGSVLAIHALNASVTGIADYDIYARANPNSVASGRFYAGFSYDTTPALKHYGGDWNDTSANITSIVINSDQTNGIGDGSELWLYKYNE